MNVNATLILELIGTIAFSISGATIANLKQMDLFGVLFLGAVTAVGGGIIRDLILGNTPPNAFTNPIFMAVALITALIVFIPWVQKIILDNPIYYGRFMFITDTIGLGIFTVNGVNIASKIYPEINYFLYVFVGLMTGVGGGLLRDMMAGDKPYIFVRHFYASASLIGAIVTVLALQFNNLRISSYIGMVVIIILRIFASHYHWSLPKGGQHLRILVEREAFEQETFHEDAQSDQ